MRLARVVAVLTLAACAAGPGPANRPAGFAVVAHVVDGDTIDVVIGRHHERVRLLGINTPEVVDPRRPVECYGPEASALTKSLLHPGTPVSLVRDVEPRDAYGRLLAYVYRQPDGLFVNLDLVVRGAALLLTFPPNTAHAAEFAAAAGNAKHARRGLWAACRGNP